MNILVTGSSKGLGRELALTFARKGHGVILHGRDEIRLSQVSHEIRTIGIVPDIVVGDLTEYSTILKLREAAERRGIQALINNAGIYWQGPAGELDAEMAGEVLATNLLAPIQLTLAVYPILRARGGHGLIININSLAAKGFNDREAAYAASKWGLRGFMGSFKFEARQAGVTVLDVYLGKMKTAMSGNQAGAIDPAEAANAIYHEWLGYPTLRVTELEMGRV